MLTFSWNIVNFNAKVIFFYSINKYSIYIYQTLCPKINTKFITLNRITMSILKYVSSNSHNLHYLVCGFSFTTYLCEIYPFLFVRMCLYVSLRVCFQVAICSSLLLMYGSKWNEFIKIINFIYFKSLLLIILNYGNGRKFPLLSLRF